MIYKKIITTGVDKDNTYISFYAKASGLFLKLFGISEKQIATTADIATSEAASNAYADGLVVGLLDDRGSHDASGNAYPSSGGSGTAGAILKGDLWFISVTGTLNSKVVEVGDSVRALVDTPSQTNSNWSVLETNIGYVPANIANPLSQFAQTTSLQLKDTITNETGSGALVFADTPTLITPILGTPTSGTLTNCTGLPVAGGGTGATTFTDAGVLIGNVTGAIQVTTAGTSGQVLTSNGTGVDPTFQAAAGGGITIGSTAITSGTNTRVLYNNAGVVGEYTLAGTGTVAVMQTSPTLVTPVLGVATATSINKLPLSQSIDSDASVFVGKDAGLNFAAIVGGGAIQNTFIGFEAGKGGVVTNAADFNTAVGYRALFIVTAGTNNTAIGDRALRLLTSGHSNVAVGAIALENTTGERNVAVGFRAMIANTSGYYNTAIGWQALTTNTIGNNNTGLGYAADVSANNLANATAVGNGAVVAASNNMRFGDGSVVGWGFGANPTAGTDAIRVGSTSSNGNAATLTIAGVWTNASDIAKKHDIKNIPYGLSEVMKLHPVTYKMNETNYQDIGFIAQEVKLILPEIVYGEEGQMTLSYSQITSVLVKAMQEQQDEIIKLNARLETLEAQFKK